MLQVLESYLLLIFIFWNLFQILQWHHNCQPDSIYWTIKTKSLSKHFSAPHFIVYWSSMTQNFRRFCNFQIQINGNGMSLIYPNFCFIFIKRIPLFIICFYNLFQNCFIEYSFFAIPIVSGLCRKIIHRYLPSFWFSGLLFSIFSCDIKFFMLYWANITNREREADAISTSPLVF